MTDKYDYREDAADHRRIAELHREEAQRVRAVADARIRFLESQALHEEAVADHIERLCTR